MNKTLTVSARIGQGSINHNNRKFFAKNVDQTKSCQNIIFINENIKTVYHSIFDKALEEYNSKQTRKDRIIPDYYEHIRQSKQSKPFHEVIFQFADKDFPDKELLKTMLCEFMTKFQERNSKLHVFNATLHMDEATPHLHIDFIPVADKQKNGLSTKVSLKQALAQQGFKSKDRKHTEWQVWCDSEKKYMGEIALSHGFQVEYKDVSQKHLDCDKFREQQQIIDIAKKNVVYHNNCIENLKNQVSTYQQELDNIQNNLELAKSNAIDTQNHIDNEKTYFSTLKNQNDALLQQNNELKQEVTQLQDEINTLHDEYTQSLENSHTISNEISKLQEQETALLSHIDALEKEKTKLLNPTQIDEFKISKNLINQTVIKSVGKQKGNETSYLQQLMNTAKQSKQMKKERDNAIKQRDIAISDKERALSERDTALKDKEQALDNARRRETSARFNAQSQVNDKLNQLSLLKKALNVPNNVDTYNELRSFLNLDTQKRNKTRSL